MQNMEESLTDAIVWHCGDDGEAASLCVCAEMKSGVGFLCDVDEMTRTVAEFAENEEKENTKNL